MLIGSRRSLLSRPAVMVPWTPLRLGAALKFWYNANTGVTGTASVTQWNDQSGNGYHQVSGVSLFSPSLNSTGFNFRPGIVFSAAGSNAMSTSTDTVAFGSSNLASVFAACTMTSSAASFAGGVGFAGNGQNGSTQADPTSVSFIMRAGSSNSFGTYRNNAQVASDAISLSTACIVGTVLDGTNATPYLNNVAGTPGATSSNFASPGTIVLGALIGGSGGAVFWDGAFGEIVGTNTLLSSADRTSLYGYLKGEWGL